MQVDKTKNLFSATCYIILIRKNRIRFDGSGDPFEFHVYELHDNCCTTTKTETTDTLLHTYTHIYLNNILQFLLNGT